MAQVVFGMGMDSTTVECLSEIRIRQKAILLSQLEDLEPTLEHLIDSGALKAEEKRNYASQIREQLLERLHRLEHRMKDAQTFYEDELNYYLSLVGS